MRSNMDMTYSSMLYQINVLYAHAPDKQTPISDQAAAFNNMHVEGKCNSIGVANLNAEMVKDWISVADNKNFAKPSVYQGTNISMHLSPWLNAP